MNFSKLAIDFPQSAITAILVVIIGSISSNLFGYFRGREESKDKKIESMQESKLDLIIEGQKTLTAEIGKVRTDLTAEIGKVRTELELIRVDVNSLLIEKAKKDGEEIGYAKAKAELTSIK